MLVSFNKDFRNKIEVFLVIDCPSFKAKILAVFKILNFNRKNKTIFKIKYLGKIVNNNGGLLNQIVLNKKPLKKLHKN